MFTVEQLLRPVSSEAPCGEDLAFSSDLDAIAQARKADDPSIEQGAWVRTLKEADWKFVARRCAELIEKRSKDLQLAVWLVEASSKTNGLRGLGDALLALGALCERYWDGLYPQLADGGIEQRIGNLAWIAARVPQLVQETLVTEGAGLSMRAIEAARGRGAEAIAEVESARKRCSKRFQTELLEQATHCSAALKELERVVDAALPDDGPGFTAAHTALQNLMHFIAPDGAQPGSQMALAQPDAHPVTQLAAMAGASAGASAGVAGAALSVGGAISSRAQALAQLRAVAAYFRQAEPHSPVAYLAEKAAAWGEQPLDMWLKSVVKDAAARAHVEEMLGIMPLDPAAE